MKGDQIKFIKLNLSLLVYARSNVMNFLLPIINFCANLLTWQFIRLKNEKSTPPSYPVSCCIGIFQLYTYLTVGRGTNSSM